MSSEELNALKTGFTAVVDKLELIGTEIQGMRGEIQGMHGEIQGMHGEIQGLRGEFTGLRGEFKELREEFHEFREETRNKLDGIGRYLQSINGSIASHDKRITDLEIRAKKEDADK